MESKIDEILKQLHKYLFADSQQIIIELRHYLHDSSHQEADLAFISSKIFNSSESLLEFLRKNVRENDKLIAGIKKRIYELIIEYLQQRPQQTASYLKEISETCMKSFLGDPNSLVREAGLQLHLRIIDHYNLSTLRSFMQPKELVLRLLDEIKLRRPSASVKGTIWHLIGVCHQKFGPELSEFSVESQDQMYRELKEQLQSPKPEFRAIVGIIKGLSHSLEDGCTLDSEEIEGLFVRIKTAMQPIPDLRHKGIQKQSMKLFTAHVALFKSIIPRHAEPMVRLTLLLCVDANMEVRDAANDMLGRLMQVISDGLTVDATIDKKIFTVIIEQFQAILEEQNNNVQLISAIKAIGVFSKAIRTFMSEAQLLSYLERLVDLSEQRLVHEFEQQKNPEEDVQNFKYILKKQKQLISYIESYSYILLELRDPPSERIQTHFYKVCTIGVCNHRKLYEKYKHRFYESLASLLMALSRHTQIFAPWIRKFVRATLQETLKIPDAAIFGGESPEESLKDAIQFWREWLNKDQLWSERSCQTVYNELLHALIEDIKEVNLTYRVSRVQKQDEDNEVPRGQGQEDEGLLGHIDQDGVVIYHANNNNHQQYLKRLADFLELFLPHCHDKWLLNWLPQLSEVLIKKSIETPRIPRVYQILRTSMQVCNKYKYFEQAQKKETERVEDLEQSQVDAGEDQSQANRSHHGPEEGRGEYIDIREKTNVFNRLLSYFKDLIGKSEEYQDELLMSCIDLLLQVPLALLYSKDTGTDNVELWKGVMLKALELGLTDNTIAMTCINMLEQWFNRLPPNTTVKLYQEILPKLSEFLNIESEQLNLNPEYFHQQVLQKETEFGRPKISRKDIANKVLDLLGKIGGHAHSIINNELSKKHDKKNFIRWDPEKRLKFSLPLYNKKIDIYLDSCLPRIVDLAQNANKKEIRIAACEFLHALIILMIGTNAQKPKQNRRAGRGATALQDEQSREQTAAFAKLYAKLFPVMIKLATEVELISRQLFEPLCFQIVRWFSSSKIYEHAEVESLLDSLTEGAQNKNNTALRLLCSNGVAEFAKWSLKQMTDAEIAENPANIKSLIRRIESNANHPDPFKRLSSVLCFNKIFAVIREFDPLVDRFSLDICHSVLQSLKMCYDQLEQSHEVIETCRQLLPKIEKVMLKKWHLLLQANQLRSSVPELTTLLLFAFERFKSLETVYREESIKLWENLVTKSPPSTNQRVQLPNDFKRWIRDYYCVARKDRSILMQLLEIDFSSSSAQNCHNRDQKQEELLRKDKLISTKKKFDQLTAQLEFMAWLLTRGTFSLAELHKLQFRSNQIAANINSFLRNVIQKSFDKRKQLICDQVLVSKEDREQVTKSEIVVLIKLFKLLNLVLKIMQDQGEDAELKVWLRSCLQNLERGLVKDTQSSQLGSQAKRLELWDINQQYFVELAVCIVLIPQIFKLQLLVEDKELESSLRTQALAYLSSIKGCTDEQQINQKKNWQSDPEDGGADGILKSVITNNLVLEIGILNIGNIQANRSHIYSPRLLMILCLGLLKLGEVDPSLKQYLIQQVTKDCNEDSVSPAIQEAGRKPTIGQSATQEDSRRDPKSLKDVIELWLNCDSPFENESARVLIKFMSKLRIPNKVVLEWITQKNATAVYHKCNDILLQYIAARWSEPQEPEQEQEKDEAQGFQKPNDRRQLSPGKADEPSLAMETDQNDQMIPDSQKQHLIGFSQSKQSDSTWQHKLQESPEQKEPHYSCLGEFLVAKIESHQAQLYSIFVPIIEKLSESNTIEVSRSREENLKILVKYIPIHCQREIKHEFKDVAINQIRIFGLIAIKSKLLLMDSTSTDGQQFIAYLIKRISAFLKEKFSVYVKKEVFNLISLIADFPVSSGMGQEYSKFSKLKNQTVFDSLEPSLNYVKKMHFPMKSRELKPQSNEAQNFLVIVQAFLNMAIITKNLRVFRHLYQIIREHETTFEQTLKDSIKIIVSQQINILPKEEFISRVSKFIVEFKNKSLDQSICDNIRWAIAQKVLVPILETCPQERLVDVMVHWNSDFMEVLDATKFEDHVDEPLEFFNLVREKTFIMIFYEIMYRRLPTQMIKETVHKRLYGDNCQQNELTKALVDIAATGKKQQIPGFLSSCQAMIKTERDMKDEEKQIDGAHGEVKDINSLHSVQNSFSCAAYSLLSSVIVCTQTKEAAFANFLFNPRQGGATQSLWSLLIDTEQEFEFKVQTNFSHVELKSIEQKLADVEVADSKDTAGVRVQNMMNEYLTAPFMGANERFNQNMVFETQLDQINMKKEEKKLQEIVDKKFHSSNRAAAGASTSRRAGQDDQIVENEQRKWEQEAPRGDFIPDDEAQFELDQINKHQCMKNIKGSIERMNVLFGEHWRTNEQEMPKFAHYLLEEFSQPQTHVNIKIFILKIITNNPKLFKPHAHLWFEPICEYIISKNKNGKGFHYFLRDLCTMLISWDYVPKDASRTRILLTRVINTLIPISADKIKLIFKQNIQIVSTLMRKWKDLVAIDKLLITRMISIPDSKPESHLWKMNSIEILALAVCYNIPVLLKAEEEIEFMANTEKKFKMDSGNTIDPLMVAILKVYDSKKKQIIYAASELLGMILNNQAEHPNFLDLIKHCKVAIFANEVRERHDVFVYSIERVSREYSRLLCDRQIFMKTISFIDILTGSMRAAVFKTYERYIKVARQEGNLADIDEISMSIMAISKDILADINDENQQSFVSLLIVLSELQGVDSVRQLLATVVPQLKHLFVKNKNEYCRGRFYDLMVNLYDRYEEFRKDEAVKGSLIHGLNDSSQMIRDKLSGFWNDQNRLDLDPVVRLQQLMDIMYVSDEESIWLTNAAYLILQVSSRSSDFDRKIFEEPLQECQFAPLHLNTAQQMGMTNRSQPMTPLLTQVDQMLQASQNAKDVISRQQAGKDQNRETQEQALSQNQSQDQIKSATSQNRPATHQNRDKGQGRGEKPHMEQGFVRATQLPQFTQTQAMPSALVAGFRRTTPIQETLSASFYGINNKHQQNGAPERHQESARDPNAQIGQSNHPGGIKGGTQLFTIGEEAEEDEAGHISQDSEGFLAPAPMARKPANGKLSHFFRRINFAYKPMEVTEGQKIRFMHEATMPSHLARQEEVRRMQHQQFIERQIQQRRSQVSLFRKYRIGELPDIQIDFKDVLMPLMAIVRSDSTIATELFVEVFQEIYKGLKDKQARQDLGNGLKNILSSSKIYDYSMVSCAHRIAMELLKIDGFMIDPSIIERTGEHSMSFQTSLILLEESLIRGEIQQPVDEQNENGARNKRKKAAALAPSLTIGSINQNKHSITSQNREYWFKLIKLYEIIGNQDALHGIWCELAQEDGVIYKQGNQAQAPSLSQAQNQDPNQAVNQAEQNQEHAVNLIKYAQDLKNKGKIEEALHELESALNSPQLCQDFGQAIRQELETKKLEYKSELLKWDQIASELSNDNQSKQLQEIAETSGCKRVDLMIRSQLRSADHWGSLTAQVENWMRDDYSKAMLEKNFSYELSMLFLTQLDYDRARIYIEREASELLSQWKNLTKLSQVAQHFLVQRIQKIYEMKEFLSLLKLDNSQNDCQEDQMAQIIQSIINWKDRCPSASFDALSVWDDISQARQFFIDQYAMKFQGTPLQNALTHSQDKLPSLNTAIGRQLASISDIQVMLHIQTAKGAFKMGAYDSSDRYLKHAQSKRSEVNAKDMRTIVPLIKLKAEQGKADLGNMSYKEKMAKIGKVHRILTQKMDQNHSDLSALFADQSSQIEDHLVGGPSLSNIKTLLKSNFLKFDLQKKLLSIVLDESSRETNRKELGQYSENTNNYLQRCFNTLDHIQKYLQGGCLVESKPSQGNEEHVYTVHQQGKVLYKMAKFTDKLLRKMETKKSGPQTLLKQGLQVMNKSESSLAKQSISSCLGALNLGYLRASDIIPRMLDMLSKYQESVADDFIEHSKTTPAWLFLRWISQIAAIVNRPESAVITNIVAKIAQKYPQALYYPFKVIESNLEIAFGGQQGASRLFLNLQEKFRSFHMLNQWVEALDCLIFPEHRFGYWYHLAKEIYRDPSVEEQANQSTSTNNLKAQPVQRIILMMYSDIMTEEKPMVGEDIGLYNRRFIRTWESVFARSFGRDGSKVLQMKPSALMQQMDTIHGKMQPEHLFHGSELISKYSEWLDKLDCNEFHQTKNVIEIPGQYESSAFNQEPISQKNVKLASVKKVCLVLGSIRRPKKITVHGSNEKDYCLLIKGGEDLRLDQRVQQLFAIINRIFAVDPACENRDLNIKTFGVVPVTNRLGAFEWVDNTEPMKALISKEHKRLENGKDLGQSAAQSQRLRWLRKIPGNENISAPAQQHQALLRLDDGAVTKAFEDHVSAFPSYLLRSALENLCLTSSAFLTIKNQFIKSMAVFSIASYLLGIGDRHLENFLVDTSDGEVLGIDFGIAFGSGVSLSVPELMPFRLTQQIEGVIAPHPLEGIYKHTMVHALGALRKKKSLILDACEIFVSEPLLDWLKAAKQQNRSSSLIQDSSRTAGVLGATNGDETQLSWYPRKKIEVVKKKLRGGNPVKILYKELEESVHARGDYFDQLGRVIQGPANGVRHKHLSQSRQLRYLAAEDQVDILIELARDPNVLGRTWIGWSPYI